MKVMQALKKLTIVIFIYSSKNISEKNGVAKKYFVHLKFQNCRHLNLTLLQFFHFARPTPCHGIDVRHTSTFTLFYFFCEVFRIINYLAKNINKINNI